MEDDSESLAVGDEIQEDHLPAGPFSSWLRRARSAQRGERGVDLPCGDCTACCTSSYFIHVAPDETETLSRIPRELLFPAPGLPAGNVLLGYDERGHCPMLIDGGCSIYEHRPRTCRNHDCRVFRATGMSAGGVDKARITRRSRRWKFSYPALSDRRQQSAVQAAALFLRERTDCLPAGFVPSNETQLAVLALRVYEVFLGYADGSARRPSDGEIAEAVVKASERFETGGDVDETAP